MHWIFLWEIGSSLPAAEMGEAVNSVKHFAHYRHYGLDPDSDSVMQFTVGENREYKYRYSYIIEEPSKATDAHGMLLQLAETLNARGVDFAIIGRQKHNASYRLFVPRSSPLLAAAPADAFEDAAVVEIEEFNEPTNRYSRRDRATGQWLAAPLPQSVSDAYDRVMGQGPLNQ